MQKRVMVVGDEQMNKNIPLVCIIMFQYYVCSIGMYYYVSIFCVILLILSGNFYGLKIWQEIFFGLNFGLGIFLDFVSVKP